MKHILLSVSLLLLAIQARGQHWDTVTYPLPSQAGVAENIVPYFLNPDTGFAYSSAIAFWNHPLIIDTTGVARTTDGGKTWLDIPYFHSNHMAVSQIYFVTRTHGFVSAIDTNGTNGGIYETTDQGLSWNKMNLPAGQYSGIYASGSCIFASTITNIDTSNCCGPILYSRDNGIHWMTITAIYGLSLSSTPQFQFIYGNKDSLVATVYFDPNGHTFLVYSTDLGDHWNATDLGSNVWPMKTLFILSHQCRILQQMLDDSDIQNGDEFSFVRSDPDYANWQPSLMHIEMCAWMSGNACAIYECNASELHNNYSFYRSIDQGVSWSGISSASTGPYFTEYDDNDFRNIAVVGYGAIVYATGNLNFYSALWKTTDGGDGTLSEAALAPQIEYRHGTFASGNDTLTVSSCSLASAFVYYQNLRCAITTMDSVLLVGLSQGQYSLTSTHHNDCLSLPDSTYITFNSIPQGTYPITISEHFTDDEYNTIDTSLSFTLVVEPGGQNTQLHRESASAYFGGIDSLTLALDASSQVNLDSLWPYITTIQATYSWDSSVAHYYGYVPPVGWTVVSSVNQDNSVNIDLQKSGTSLPRNLGVALFTPSTSQLSTSWVELPSLVLGVGNQKNSLCATDNEDNHWSVKTLGPQSSVTEVPISFHDISVYPNPAHDEITMVAAVGAHHALEYELFDALGKSSISGFYNPDVRSTSLQLDVSSLAAGTYFLRLSENGYVETRRVVIER